MRAKRNCALQLKDELGAGNVKFFAAREYTPDDVLRELGLKRIV